MRHLTGLSEADFDALYRAEHGRVVSYLYYRVGPSAPDLAGEVFARAWAARHAFDPARGTSTQWLWSIARNMAKDRLKAAPQQSTLGADIMAPAMLEDDAQLALDLPVLELALADLNSRDREIIALRFGGGYSYRDIAELLGISEGNAAVRLHRAIRNLRTRFERREHATT